MKVWLVLAATWIWWAAVVGPVAWVCSSSFSVTGGKHNNNLSFNSVEFRVTGCTKGNYSTFLQSLRTQLSSGKFVHDIPLLPVQSGSQQDLLLVKLFDWGNMSITLVLDRVNAYVIAYEAQNRYYLLNDTLGNPFYGSKPYRLSFTGSYTAQNVAQQNREKIDLGINELATAITTLYYWSPSMVEKVVARSLIVLIQMVSETARFGAIEKKVKATISDNYGSFCPGVGVIDLETNWATLSTAVQQANAKGEFLRPVELKVTYQTTEVISDAKKAQTFCGLALLLNILKGQASLSSHDLSVFSTSRDLNIRSMLDIAA